MPLRIVSLAILLGLTSASARSEDPPHAKPPAPPATVGDLRPFTVAVVDDETGKPVTAFSDRFGYDAPGRVSPFTKEWRAVESPSGTFELPIPPACRLYVRVRPRDVKDGRDGYSQSIVRSTDNPRRAVVKVYRGATVHGTVRDAATHKPIAGAIIIPRSEDSAYSMIYTRVGYVPREIWSREYPRDGIVVLERRVSLEGQVLGPDGQPVRAFVIRVELSNSPSQPGWPPSARQGVDDPAGRFKLDLDRGGRAWVGVRAEGYASGEVVTDIPPNGGTLTVRLEPGAPVTGRILAPPGGLAKLEARLFPRHRCDFGTSESNLLEWLARTATVAADGTLRFEHVRPDRYTLLLKGPGVTSRVLALDVPGGGLDLGQLRLMGRGRIHGRAFNPKERGGGARVLDHGRIYFAPAPPSRFRDFEVTPFMTDEDGWFSVEGVPVGFVDLGFPIIGPDTVMTDTQEVVVCEGQTTEMRLFDPAGTRSLTVDLRVGDGSEAQYRSGSGLGEKSREPEVKDTIPGAITEWQPTFFADLIPRSGGPLSSVLSELTDPGGKAAMALTDVAPGAYRLRVFSQLAPVGFRDRVNALFERDITIPTNESPIKVTLGAGSLKGRFLMAGKPQNWGEVIAVARGGRGPARRTRADGEGSYCLRYLEPGAYTLIAHFPGTGWARVEDVEVRPAVTEAGDHPLARGGTVRGSISFRRPCPLPEEVVATGPSRIELASSIRHDSGYDQFELGGLWPGRWSISVRGGRGAMLATATVEISGTETVPLTLAAEPEKQP